jgi:hypothetical protein
MVAMTEDIDIDVDFHHVFSNLLASFPEPPKEKPKMGLEAQWSRISKDNPPSEESSRNNSPRASIIRSFSDETPTGTSTETTTLQYPTSPDAKSRPSGVGTAFDDKAYDLLCRYAM